MAVVVLAGGTSRRFGSDKLAAAVDGSTLLDAALAALPAGADVVLVGPARPTSRAVHVVREDPPGGGPAAALVTGLRFALDGPAAFFAVLPADAPDGGHAAAALLGLLRDDPTVTAAVAVDDEGRDQPLQLALRRPAARALVTAAPDGGRDASARRLLVGALGPDLRRVVLPPRSLFDVDTPAQLAAWTAQSSPAVTALVELATRKRMQDGRPVVLALDGASGSGKSTLAAALRLRTAATVLPGDDFYSVAFAETDPTVLGRLDDGELAGRVFDWSRLRTEALEPLAAGRPARYRPFDWTAVGRDRLGPPRTLPAAPLVVLEGVYAARPELADLVTASVLVRADETERQRRLAARIDGTEWPELWRRGEQHYFRHVLGEAELDLVLG